MKMRETKEKSSEDARIEVQMAPRGVESGEEACLLPPSIKGFWECPKLLQRGTGQNPNHAATWSVLRWLIKIICQGRSMQPPFVPGLKVLETFSAIII